MWCQHHNGMFRSIDGGATFSEITDVEPSVFGFAVAAHPHDAQTAWFVPAQKDEMRIPVDGRMVVTRTRDGGESFEMLVDGLARPTRVPPRLPARARRRRDGRAAGDGEHDGFGVGQRETRATRGTW